MIITFFIFCIQIVLKTWLGHIQVQRYEFIFYYQTFLFFFNKIKIPDHSMMIEDKSEKYMRIHT